MEGLRAQHTATEKKNLPTTHVQHLEGRKKTLQRLKTHSKRNALSNFATHVKLHCKYRKHNQIQSRTVNTGGITE